MILPERPHKVADWGNVELEGREIVVVQTKRCRLGMYLMGQALFSRELVRRFNPRSIRSVAPCEARDSVLSPLLKEHGLEIVVYPGESVEEQ